jgi:myosin heavy subunit
VTAILNALKAILHLGNISFEEAASGEGSGILADSLSSLQQAATLLGFPTEDLSGALVNRTLSVRGEVMVVPLDPLQAVDTRNAFSKEIYGRLFAQIVHHANKSLSFKAPSGGKTDKKKKKDKIISIGLLDIFGFEIFVSNSFEQLCINYGNEKLQQYFINYVLKKEQDTYESEGIDVDKIETLDNEDILQFLEAKKTGMFALLDEELRLPRGSDSGFLKKVEKEYKEKTSRFRQDFR